MTMQQPENRQRGASGQTGVKLFFEDRGWGAIETSGEHDLGTDLLVQVRDTHLTDMSLMFGVQVKTGDSWFKEPADVEGQAGWIFREDTHKHANYWSNHPLPHILVIQNDARTERYWAFLNRETIQPTGKGLKVFVPASQPLDPSFRSVWVEATEKALKRIALEGSRWSFDVAAVSTSDRARYALLAAHLAAPHPNKGTKTPISWVEAVAICISADAQMWEQNASRHPEVPDFDEAAVSSDWGWQFAAAIYKWMYEADTEPLESLNSSAQMRQYQIVHIVTIAVALIGNGRLDDAAAHLARFSVETEFSIEQAWLSVHRSHIAMEIGDVEEARRLAQLSYVQLAPVGADITASSIRAASAWAIFDTAEGFSLDVGPVVSALDNPSTWWRTQTISAGLEAALKRHFRNWSHDESVVFGAANTPHNALLSASVQARLAGLFSQAKNSGSLRAKIELSIPSDHGRDLFSALDTLRLSGDEKGLVLAIPEIGRTGPLNDLRQLVDQVTPASMTRTTSRADLRVIQHAGIYAEPQHARDLVDHLLSALEDPQIFERRVSARYLVGPALLEALAGLRDFLQPEHWSRLLELLVTRPQDEASAGSLHRLLIIASVSDADRDRLYSMFPTVPEWYQKVLLPVIGTRTEADRENVRQELLAGNIDALASLQGRLDNLELDEAGAVSAALVAAVEAERSRRLDGIVVRSRDVVADLAVVAIVFPDLDGWATLIAFFGDPAVAAYRKREAALLIARNAHVVPAEVRPGLSDAVIMAREQPRNSSPSLGFEPDVGGALDSLYMALLEASDSRRDTTLLSLLLGTTEERRDAVLYLAHSEGTELQLVQLIKDTDHEVAATAAVGLARTARRSPDPNPDIVKLLTDFASENSTLGHPIAVGLSGQGPLHPELRPIVEALQLHTSVRVRQLAEELAKNEAS